jgi:3-oxoacyl-[acyl-carrier-protein] synthase-3
LIFATAIGSGTALPPYRATNEAIARFFPKPEGKEWTPSWVVQRLGVLERRNAFDFDAGELRPGYYDGDLAYEAARNAIKNAGIEANEIARVIYATSTPEYTMPDPACVLHDRLGLPPDSSAIGLTSVGCGGFIYALDIADSEIRAGKYDTVLVVGSVSIGPYIAALTEEAEPEERTARLLQNLPNAYIFGEGAGAFVLRATEDPDHGIRFIYTGASHADNPVIVEAGGSRRPATHATVRAGLHRFNMDAGLVKHVGPQHFVRAVKTLEERSGIAVGEVDHYIFHQVNARLLRRIAGMIGAPWSKVVRHVERYGNLDTATLPVAFHEARAEGRIKSGDLVMFAAIGAGWQFGAAVLRV